MTPAETKIPEEVEVENPLHRLTPEQIEAIGKEFDELHDQVFEDMEIGPNVMHGQWDWMNHPVINSSTWDWDTASTAEAWKHSHNYIHHTYTNIRGKDKDLGYEIMRIDPHQKWHPAYLAQPLYNLLLMAFFEWGVAVHDLAVEAIRAGEKSKEEVRRQVKGMAAKARSQIVKDYIA